MDMIPQGEALGLRGLGKGERATLFAAPPFAGLDCLSAIFRRHAYAPHQHETFVIGGIVAGCETFRVRGVRHYARAGQIAFVNPLETHDGEPLGEGYAYRMTYPSAALLEEVAAALGDAPRRGTPHFPEPLVADAEGAGLFVAAHRALEAGEDLAGEEMLLRFYARCLARHAGWPVAPVGPEAGPVARARAAMAEEPEEAWSLTRLGRLAGLPRHNLIRAFRAETGLTPHAWLLDLRVRRAGTLLKSGALPGEAAAATGFCDQAHLTRAFKARHGVTPGAYRAAHLS